MAGGARLARPGAPGRGPAVRMGRPGRGRARRVPRRLLPALRRPDQRPAAALAVEQRHLDRAPRNGRREPCYFDADGRGTAGTFLAAYQDALAAIGEPGHIALPTANHDFARLQAGPRTPEQLPPAFAFLLTFPTLPAIYYGDEIGMRYVPGLPDTEGSVDALRLQPGRVTHPDAVGLRPQRRILRRPGRPPLPADRPRPGTPHRRRAARRPGLAAAHRQGPDRAAARSPRTRARRQPGGPVPTAIPSSTCAAAGSSSSSTPATALASCRTAAPNWPRRRRCGTPASRWTRPRSPRARSPSGSSAVSGLRLGVVGYSAGADGGGACNG